MGQFKALASKNWILYKRSICGNIAEILIPIFFAFIIILVRKLVIINNYSQQSFLTNSTYAKTIYGLPAAASLAGGSSYLK